LQVQRLKPMAFIMESMVAFIRHPVAHSGTGAVKSTGNTRC